MTHTLDLGLPDAATAAGDNITEWCLETFHAAYGDEVTKDDIWEYLYGVMHAPDWRNRYRHDLARNLARIPLAEDFETFRSSGRALMDLHLGYETAEEWPVRCLVDGQADEGDAGGEAYRIDAKLTWGTHPDGSTDKSVLLINSRCQLVDIPPEAHHYDISGRSPLQWAIASLRHKHHKESGIIDDPNKWDTWANEPFNLVRHLRRLIYISVETARIVSNLPPSLPKPGPDASLHGTQ